MRVLVYKSPILNSKNNMKSNYFILQPLASVLFIYYLLSIHSFLIVLPSDWMKLIKLLCFEFNAYELIILRAIRDILMSKIIRRILRHWRFVTLASFFSFLTANCFVFKINITSHNDLGFLDQHLGIIAAPCFKNQNSSCLIHIFFLIFLPFKAPHTK